MVTRATTRTTSWCGAAVALAAALAAGPARAATPREQAELEARRACAAGRVGEGIEMLAALLTEYGHPNYIYNQARCYQQNGKREQAIARFKEYLRAAPEAPPAERTRIQGFIHELEVELQRTPAPPVPAPPVTAGEPPPARVPSPERAARAAASTRPRSAAVAVERRRPGDQAPARPLRTAGIAFGAVSAAGLATGLVFSLKIQSLTREVETARKLDAATLAASEVKGHGYETWQWVGYGVGGAALAGAVICLVMDGNHQKARKRVALTGTIDLAGRPGLAVAGRF